MTNIAAIINALGKALGTSLEESRFGWIKLSVLFVFVVAGAIAYNLASRTDPNKIIERQKPVWTYSPAPTASPFCFIFEDTIICDRGAENSNPESAQTGQKP